MTKWKKWLSTLLIIVGLGIAAFPIEDKIYINYWNQRLLEAYDNELTLNEEATLMAESDYLALQAIYANNDSATTGETTWADTSEVDTFENSTAVDATELTTSKPKTIDKSVIGKIKISKIDLIMPVLMGATGKKPQ